MTPSEKDTLQAILEHCLAWEPNARILGNVRASDAVDAIRAALRAEADSIEKAAGEITPEMDGALLAQMMYESTQYADAREGPGAPDWGSAYSAKLATLAASHGARREREECAALADDLWTRAGTADDVAEAIRAREP